MHRSQFYDQSQDRTFDDLWAQRHALYALGQLTGDFLGGTATFVAGLGATPTGPTSLTINLAAGEIYSQAAVDSAAYGSLTADSDQTMQQGYALAQALLLSTSGISSGQSRYTLIQASFSQVDDIPSDDPTAGLLTYLNGSDPNNPQATPWSGPSNSGATQNTRRKGVCVISTVNGTAATTGSEVPPNPSDGAVGLYLVDLAFGQTTIAANQILIAGPSVGTGVPSNYPVAPFLAGLNQKPTVGSFAGNPNGSVAGSAWPLVGSIASPNQIFDTTNKQLWMCSVSGSATTALWIAVGASALAFTQVGAGINKYRNATFGMWGRGNSITVAPGSPVYTADGWLIGCSGASVTVTKAGGLGLGPNALQITGQSGVTDVFAIHVIESITAQALAGQNCVNQIKILNNSGATLNTTATYKHAGSTNTWSSSTTDFSGVTLQTVANSVIGQLSDFKTLPSGWSQGGSVRFDWGGALNGAAKSITIGDPDIRVGVQGTVPLPEIRNITLEILECGRYLPSFSAAGVTSAYMSVGGVMSTPATAGGIWVPFPTQTRIPVTGVTLSATSDFQMDNAGVAVGLTSLTFALASLAIGELIAVPSSGTFNPGDATNIFSANGNARMYFTGAELTGSAL